MSKTEMVEAIVAAHPLDLMIESLWQDRGMRDLVKNRLLAISEQNLQPYHDHFVGDTGTVTEKPQPRNVAVFSGGDSTADYVAKLHES